MEHGRQLFFVVQHPAQHALRIGGRDRAEVGPDPPASSIAEALDLLHPAGRGSLNAHAASSRCATIVAMRWRWSAGVPYKARLTVTRRRNRCRSWSNVMPMPP